MDPDRRSDEIQRIWRHISALEKDVESLEKITGGLHYGVFGIPEVPGSGLVNTVDRVNNELVSLRRAIAGLIGTAVFGLGAQLLVHFT